MEVVWKLSGNIFELSCELKLGSEFRFWVEFPLVSAFTYNQEVSKEDFLTTLLRIWMLVLTTSSNQIEQNLSLSFPYFTNISIVIRP